jgi:DHA2 family methylenomycin A resistance protein-like MFS transporter
VTTRPRSSPTASSARSAAGGVATLLATSAGFFMVSLDVTIVNVALPTLQHHLGATLQGLQWIVDGYTLSFAAFLLTGGSLGDVFGARRVFSIGLLVFSLASAACGISPTSGILIGARIAQGFGAALLVPCSLAILRNAFTDQGARGRAIAVWAAAGGAAIAAGPVLGGLLIDALGWRSVFLVNLLVGAAVLGVTFGHVQSVDRRGGRIDLPGQLTGALAVGGLTFALIEGPRLGWDQPSVCVAIASALVGAIAFALCERCANDPLLPPSLMRHREFAGAALVGALLNLAFYGEVFVLSLFFQQARGESPLRAGLSFLPMTGLITLANLSAPRISRRIGTAATIVSGELILAAGMAAVALIDARSPWWMIALALLPIGIGGGVSIPPLTSQLLESVPASTAGVASGAFNASRQVGGAIGVALFGALLGGGSGSFSAGMRATLVVAAGAAMLAATLTTTLLGAAARTPNSTELQAASIKRLGRGSARPLASFRAELGASSETAPRDRSGS